MSELTFGSLFAGIGGFDLGFERAGMRCLWQVERDEKALSQLDKHWPNTEKIKDVRDVTAKNTTAVDLICGGFPCQDVSVAGRRQGLAGERSGLWFEFRRIIGELKPKWVVIENVPGLLSSNGGRDMGAVVGGLAELGYWWAYRVLDAQYFGVPQRRRRVFIVASLTAGRPQQVLFERDSSPWDTPPGREAGPDFAAAITERTRDAGRTLEMQNDLAYALTNPGSSGRPHSRLIAFQQNTRDEVRLMNGDGQIAGALAAQPGMKQQNYIANTFNGYTGGADDNDAQGNHLVTCLTPWDAESKRIHNPAAPSPTLAGSDGGGGQRTPYFAVQSWEMSHADEAVRLNGDISPTLQKRMGTGSNQVPMVGVRRLTPLECERLQGFPDDWTAGQSDSARYRQLGNAVAVPVAEWLGKRIISEARG